jgi:hypothetical protein
MEAMSLLKVRPQKGNDQGSRPPAMANSLRNGEWAMTKIEDRVPRTHFPTLLHKAAIAGNEIAFDSNSNRELDRRLDEALKETFPASDPISIVISL